MSVSLSFPVQQTVSEAHRLRLDPIATPDRLLVRTFNADPRVLTAISRPPLVTLIRSIWS